MNLKISRTDLLLPQIKTSNGQNELLSRASKDLYELNQGAGVNLTPSLHDTYFDSWPRLALLISR